MDRQRALSEGVVELGLRLDRDARNRLVRFLDILEHWNRSLNLTAVPPREMVSWHLLDSLSVAPFLQPGSMLDVGSGAGFPGIPLAIAAPKLRVVLLDSRSRRVEFLRHSVSALRLANVDIAHQRVEQYRPRRKFDTLVARAFGPLPGLVAAAAHLCRPGGRILALKGRYPATEIAQIDTNDVDVLDVVKLRVPQLDAARHLVIMRPAPQGRFGTRERSPDKG